MSHFTVLVIGEGVEGQLAPFHEFECTGTDDEYVVDHDETDEYRKTFKTAESVFIQDTGGTLHYAYGTQFYPGGGKRVLPPGWFEAGRMPVKDHMTFAEWISGAEEFALLGPNERRSDEHKYTWAEVNAEGEVTRVVRHTNPNAQWDWYVVGGRWAGFFALKPDVQCPDRVALGEHQGTAVALGMKERVTSPSQADSAMKGDIDFHSMRDEKGAIAALRWEQAWEIMGHENVGNAVSWKARCAKFTDADGKTDYAAAREDAAINPCPVAAKLSTPEAKERWADAVWLAHSWPEVLDMGKEGYVDHVRRSAVSTFAVLKDGEWYQRGDMGWWGTVSDEMDDEEWLTKYDQLLESIDDDVQLTIVDCHI